MDKTLGKVLDKIQSDQITIDKLLKGGLIQVKSSQEAIDEGKWIIDIFYSKPDCTMGFATCNSVGGEFPDHIHKDVREYLICVEGSFMESFGRCGVDGLRIVNEGECVSVPANMVHASKPITEKTRMIFICVPCDPCIPVKELNYG